MNQLALTSGNVLQNVAELAKGDVANLAAPKLVHGFDIQCFQNAMLQRAAEIANIVQAARQPTTGTANQQQGDINANVS